ncbi:mitochondrial ribosomal protein L46 isoform X2 [Megachile rotundata]|uniref:mitochondrial ribosomal protein L46 isoform X2 n=1 Tax=Megachile rotundata TaxID=143995 RepID=UPI000614AC72|nr:PREDICTED: 39S ribosomal protein L46, mitochondrial isoform X2 [Megachile rotundata]
MNSKIIKRPIMFKKLLTPYRLSNLQLFEKGTIRYASEVIAPTSSDQNIVVAEKWDLLSAVCLERHPVITKPMKDIEVRYEKMLRQIEFENSILSDFELKKQKEIKQTTKQSDLENITLHQTAQDFEDACDEELRKFQFAPRENETEDNTIVSLRRKLDKNLLLLVEQKIGDVSYWIPPQSIRQQSETMIQTARRSLEEFCGNNVKVQFYGNAPIGFYKYLYPKSIRAQGKDGAKVFYFLAKYISGDVSSNAKHGWLDREELKKTVHPRVHKSLSQFLIPD